MTVVLASVVLSRSERGLWIPLPSNSRSSRDSQLDRPIESTKVQEMKAVQSVIRATVIRSDRSVDQVDRVVHRTIPLEELSGINVFSLGRRQTSKIRFASLHRNRLLTPFPTINLPDAECRIRVRVSRISDRRRSSPIVELMYLENPIGVPGRR